MDKIILYIQIKMNKRIGYILAFYFIWVSFYRNFAGNDIRWDSMFFIIENSFVVFLFFELKRFITNKILTGFLWTGIAYKSFMVIYDIAKFTSCYDNYVLARKNYINNSIGALLIISIILITLICHRK